MLTAIRKKVLAAMRAVFFALICAAVLQAQGVSFVARREFNLGTNLTSIATGDLNGDGIPDLVAVAPNASGVAVLLGQADGSFQSSFISVSSGATVVALADMNGDGKLDLVIAAQFNNVLVLLG